MSIHKPLLAVLSAGVLLFSSIRCAPAASACDLNGDGVVNAADVTLASKMASGLAPCTAAVAGAGVCNAVVVQRVTAASSGGLCVVGYATSFTLNWTASRTLPA